MYKPGQTKQFDTFDTKGDRLDLVRLFGLLGDGLTDLEARQLRAKFLEGLMVISLSLACSPVSISPDSCSPTGAYITFVQIVGILGVPISDAAKILEAVVRRKAWMKTNDRRALVCRS